MECTREFLMEYLSHPKDDKGILVNEPEFKHKTKFKAVDLISAMRYAAAKHPHFERDGIDWHCHPIHGLLLQSKDHTLYLTEIVGYYSDGSHKFYGNDDME